MAASRSPVATDAVNASPPDVHDIAHQAPYGLPDQKKLEASTCSLERLDLPTEGGELA